MLWPIHKISDSWHHLFASTEIDSRLACDRTVGMRWLSLSSRARYAILPSLFSAMNIPRNPITLWIYSKEAGFVFGGCFSWHMLVSDSWKNCSHYYQYFHRPIYSICSLFIVHIYYIYYHEGKEMGLGNVSVGKVPAHTNLGIWILIPYTQDIMMIFYNPSATRQRRILGASWPASPAETELRAQWDPVSTNKVENNRHTSRA